jgi:hypothetical protein
MNYRRFFLLNSAYEIYIDITNAKRTTALIEHILQEEQCGFDKNMFHMHEIFTMKQGTKKRKGVYHFYLF